MSIPDNGFVNDNSIGVGKYTSTPWSDYTTIGTFTGGGYTGTLYPTAPATISTTQPQVAEILTELRRLRDDLAAEQHQTKAELTALAEKIAALHQMIEIDATLKDRKDAQRTIAALEIQLAEFREYYKEAQEKFYQE